MIATRIKKNLAVLTSLASAALLAGCSNEHASTPTPEAKQAEAPGRNTMNVTLPQLVARYNRFASLMTDSDLLPDGMQEAVRNDYFHTYTSKIKTGSVTIEADNKSGMPFSIGAIVGADNQDDIIHVMSVMAAIGATVLGRGPQSGALMQTCTEATKSKTLNAKKSIGDFSVYCSSVMGAWMAGITVDKDRVLADGLAVVPMQADQKN